MDTLKRLMFPALTLVAVVLLAVSIALAQGSGRDIKMDFEQVDIRVLINFISELTGKNFVVDDKVGGKVTVRSPSGISVDEAYKVFESVLEVNGFTILPSGSVNKIVPAQTAKQRNVEVLTTGDRMPKSDDRIVSQLVFLKNASAKEVHKLLVPLISPAGAIMAYSPTELLVITDYSLNVQRLVKIVQEIDVPIAPDARVAIFPLTNAGAERTADKISNLLTAQAKREDLPTESVFKIVPDSRTNIILVFASEARMKMVQDLVKALDQPLPVGQGNVNVVYLKNADAVDLAKVISGLPVKTTAEKTPDQKEGAAPAASTQSSDVRIVADKATNSLIITAPPEEFRVYEAMIKQLDVPRRQVYVEAVIMEVSTDKTVSMGVNWTAGHSFNNGNSVYWAGSNPGQIANSLTAVPDGLSFGVLTKGVTIGGVTIQNMGALVQAAETDKDFNVISTPQLMTLDNEEAKVVVAKNIPYTTSQQTNTSSSTGVATQSYEYKDVGTTLKVTPQISAQGTVRLKIYEEVSSIVSTTQDLGNNNIALAPTTNKRSAEARVEVQNGQTVVIAGLLGGDINTKTNQVPLLGDIPGLGWLFKYKSKEATKTNLLVFLTPHILEDSEDAKKLYKDKMGSVSDVLQLDESGRSKAALKPAFSAAPVLAQ